MVKTTTIAELQDALKANPETSDIDVWSDDDQKSAPNPLAALAERMVRERPAGDGHVGDPFDGMTLDVDPADAFGLVQANVTAWLEERGRWATPLEIKHQVERLMADAQNARPGPVKSATYTVAPDGTVSDYTPDVAPAELPEMPPAPEPKSALRPPSDSAFVDGWAESTALVQRAITLIKRHPDELEHLHGLPMSLRWKQKGGKSRGRPIYGQTVKTGGLLKHFSASTFVIWLAADHVLAARYGDREIEALLFRQLLAAGVAEIDEDTGRGGGATLVPPDVQVYEAELRVYGAWEAALKSAAKAFRQVSLFDAPADDDQGQYTCVRCEDGRTHVRRGLCQDCTQEAAAEWLEREYPSTDEDEEAAQIPSEGVLIHDDGTPLTADEIAEMEAAELRDDPAEFDEYDEDDDE